MFLCTVSILGNKSVYGFDWTSVVGLYPYWLLYLKVTLNFTIHKDILSLSFQMSWHQSITFCSEDFGELLQIKIRRAPPPFSVLQSCVRGGGVAVFECEMGRERVWNPWCGRTVGCRETVQGDEKSWHQVPKGYIRETQNQRNTYYTYYTDEFMYWRSIGKLF